MRVLAGGINSDLEPVDEILVVQITGGSMILLKLEGLNAFEQLRTPWLLKLDVFPQQWVPTSGLVMMIEKTLKNYWIDLE